MQVDLDNQKIKLSSDKDEAEMLIEDFSIQNKASGHNLRIGLDGIYADDCRLDTFCHVCCGCDEDGCEFLAGISEPFGPGPDPDNDNIVVCDRSKDYIWLSAGDYSIENGSTGVIGGFPACAAVRFTATVNAALPLNDEPMPALGSLEVFHPSGGELLYDSEVHTTTTATISGTASAVDPCRAISVVFYIEGNSWVEGGTGRHSEPTGTLEVSVLVESETGYIINYNG